MSRPPKYEVQIKEHIQYLNHVKVQYDLTKKNYQTIESLFSNLSMFLLQQVSEFDSQNNLYTTPQGKGLKIVMLEHFKSLTRKIKEQADNLKTIHVKIQNKCEQMNRCQLMIKPIVKNLTQKQSMLQNQLSEMQWKLFKVSHTDQNTMVQDLKLNSLKQSSQNQDNMATSNYSEKRQILRDVPPFKQLFNDDHLKKLMKTVEAKQLEPFYQIKLIEVKKIMKFQSKVAAKTLQYINQLFNKNLGKGIEQFENHIADHAGVIIEKGQNRVSYENLSKVLQSSSKNQNESNNEESQESQDLKCHERMQDLVQIDKHGLQNIIFFPRKIPLFEPRSNQKLTQKYFANEIKQAQFRPQSQRIVISKQLQKYPPKSPANANGKKSRIFIENKQPESFDFVNISKSSRSRSCNNLINNENVDKSNYRYKVHENGVQNQN